MPTSVHSWAAAALVPDAWRSELPAHRYFVFNPGLVWTHGRYVMVYRVVAPGYATQRLALCELDTDLAVIPGSVRPLSDALGAEGLAIADPRCIVDGDRLLIGYCAFRWPTSLMLLELDAATLAVVRPPRLLVLETPRQVVEKNWMPFVHDGELYMVYRIQPHVVLHVDRADMQRRDIIPCRPIHEHAWDAGAYARRWGELRGGAPPLRWGDQYVVVFHSSYPVDRLYPVYQWMREMIRPRREAARFIDPRLTGGDVAPPDAAVPPGARQRFLARLTRRMARLHYMAGLYTFDAAPPFAPHDLAPMPILNPLEEPAPQREEDRLRPVAEQVVFPCGLTPDRRADDRWLISYGVHDERCAVRSVAAQDLLDRCRSLQAPS